MRKKRDIGNDCYVSIDCVDCPIEEPHPFDTVWSKRWFSPKFKGPGLRYEIAISILEGDIVWVNGPFPPGLYNDVQIFEEQGLQSMLEKNERVECDGIYIGCDPVYCKSNYGITHAQAGKEIRNRVRARHETGNRRLKIFNYIRDRRSRHGILKHGTMFKACARIVQISIEEGDKLFEITNYSDAEFLKEDMKRYKC